MDTYKAWQNMKTRCLNQNRESYPGYGGRGITICDRWISSFAAFLEDMGERPPGMMIDRIDNNGNYEPGNCRWATNKEQANNRRSTLKITFKGITRSAAQWGEELGLSRSLISGRLRKGWPIEKALSQNKFKGGKKRDLQFCKAM
jgi:hypothetical protein